MVWRASPGRRQEERCMDYGLTDRVVVITGAGAGIGLETARAFLREGAKVVAVDLDPSAAAEAGDGSSVLDITADLRDAAAAGRVVAAALDGFGRVDVLFNNAGVAAVRPGFLEVDDATWAQTLELNLMGYVRMSRAVLPHMLERGRGVLIHTASEAGRMPNPRLPDYSVSKAAVLMLSKALASEYTPRGVRSNVVSPAHTRTPLWDKPGGFLDTLAADYGVDRDAAIERYLRDIKMPAGRLGRPQDTAGAVLFLASEHADFITGADLAVDGGVRPFV
jgi:NAD(P)-dependent dehydrogenase (short-subunit alcohol dehydrogenase family)